MMYPPSLSGEVKARAFGASNGELGVLPADVPSFLAACRSDGLNVLGWELWLADPFSGQWTGLIPVRGSEDPVVFTSESDATTSERELDTLDWNEIEPSVRPCIRVNFTLDD